MKQPQGHILFLIACVLAAELIGDVCAFKPKAAERYTDKIRSSSMTSTLLKRQWSSLHHSPQDDYIDESSFDSNKDDLKRRRFFQQCFAMVTAPMLTPQSANAFGLVQFPCELPLLNTYHFMCAGENLMEEEDIISTNPLFLTNREAALSPKGIAQVQEACKFLEENQINPSVVKYSLAAASMDTTAIVKDTLKVGQNRIIPEFTFMDPRGIGKWDMMSYSQTLPAIYALDAAEAGKDGKEGRPPANDDGTPNETLAEQKVRLVQLMSVLETQFQGDTVLLVFPDGATPALLSCMMAGIPFNKVHELEFAPGEVRLYQDMANVRQFYEKQQLAGNGDYEKTLRMGKVELERLRGLDPTTMVNKKDLRIEKEAAEIEEQQQQRNEQKRLKAQKEEETRILRQHQIQEAKEKAAQARMEKQQTAALQRMAQSSSAHPPSEAGDKTTQLAIGGVVSLAAAAALATGRSDSDPVVVSSGSAAISNSTFTSPLNATISSAGTVPTNATSTQGLPQTLPQVAVPFGNAVSSNTTAPTSGMPETLPQVSLPGSNGASSNTKSLYSDPLPTMEEKKQAAAKAMQEYLDEDDGGGDWLTVMGQLMDDDDEEEKDELDTSSEWQ